MGILISKIDEVIINVKIVNWKVIVMFLIFQVINKRIYII